MSDIHTGHDGSQIAASATGGYRDESLDLAATPSTLPTTYSMVRTS